MTDFALNTVIVSILIAFALTGILSSWGRLVEARGRVLRPGLSAAAFVFTPSVPDEGELDLEQHYFSVAPWSYRLAAAYVAFAGVADLLVPGEASTPRPIALVLTSVLLLLSFTKSPRLHGIGLVFLWIAHVIKFTVGTR